MKSTKKSLLLSTLSLLLCFAMLLGTTWAWFTDEVTSGTNKIVAGNLDIEVSYKENGDWVSIEGKDSLFNKNALWEPGHTEYVNLKIENKGTLALTYKLMVTPVNEAGGINMAGQSFKLSDYLVFGTATATEAGYATREAARAAVTNANTVNGLNQANLVKTNTILTTGGTEYVTLVVYMPESVGNEANYKTGTTAPQIELGIKVVATQVENESDSFGIDYDAGAKTTESKYITDSYYSYFEQVNATAQATAGQITVVEKGNSGTTNYAKATVPANGAEEGANVNLSIAKTSAPASFDVLAPGKAADHYDVKVTGANAGTLITVEWFIGKGMENVELKHSGEAMNSQKASADQVTTDQDWYYNASTGVLTMCTKTFSPFSVIYDEAVAVIGNVKYGTLAAAITDVQANETITLLKNCSGNGIVVPMNSYFTVNFNGFTYTVNTDVLAGSNGTKNQCFQLLKGSTLIFKNGAIVADNSAVKMIIQNYANLTLDNMTLDATRGTNNVSYVVSNNCGNVTIKDTTITAANNGVAFDVYGGFSNYNDVTVTVTGNSVINGKVEVARGTGTQNKNTLTINGGTINGKLAVTPNDNTTVTITGGTFSSDPSAYVKTGYCAVPKDGQYAVIEGAFAKAVEEAKTAIAKGGKVILGDDMNLTDVDFVNATELDLGGHTITSNNANTVNGGENLTMKNGELKFTDDHSFTYIDVRPDDSTNGVYTFEGMKFTSEKKDETYGSCTDRIEKLVALTAEKNNAAKFIFKDCVFNNAKVLFSGMDEGGTFDAVFENCTFTGLGSSEFIDASSYYVSGTITIKNCTFTMEATSSSAAAIEARNSVTVNFEGANTVNIISATPVSGGDPKDDVILFSNPVTSAKVVSGSNVTVNGKDTVTVSGIATK